MLHIYQTLTVWVSIEECETTYRVWRRRWKHWGGHRAADGHTNAAFIDMPFMRF